MIKYLFFILSIMIQTSFIFADLVTEQADKVSKIEENLKNTVDKYNNALKNKDKSKQKEFEEKTNELEEKLKAEVLKYNELLRNEKEKKKENELSLPQNLSSDPEILKDQLKQLVTAVEILRREVKEIKAAHESLQRINSIKNSNDEPIKNSIGDISEAQAQFDKALQVFNKTPEESITLFEKIARENPDELIAIDSHLKIAEAYMHDSKWDLSNRTLTNLIKNTQLTSVQNVEALLLLADSQRSQNDRTTACKTLAELEKSNLTLTTDQNIRYQKLIVSSDCASKLDKDVRKEENEGNNDD